MTKRKMKQAKWFGLFVEAMVICYHKGELWDAGEMK